MRLKVGDVVVLLWRRSPAYDPNRVWLETPTGSEGTVLGPSLAHPGEVLVRWQQGHESTVLPSQIRRKPQPSAELGSWSEIERTVGWSPTREIA